MPQSIACTFIGYGNRYKGYKYLAPNGRIYIARHVLFDETKFPFATSNLNSPITNSTDNSSCLYATASLV